MLAMLVCSCSNEGLLRAAFALRGATEAQQNDAVKVGKCESGPELDAHAVGGSSVGIMQINWAPGAQRARVIRLGYTREDLFDPWINAWVAADLWVDLGRRFGSSAGWSCARIVGVR